MSHIQKLSLNDCIIIIFVEHENLLFFVVFTLHTHCRCELS